MSTSAPSGSSHQLFTTGRCSAAQTRAGIDLPGTSLPLELGSRRGSLVARYRLATTSMVGFPCKNAIGSSDSTPLNVPPGIRQLGSFQVLAVGLRQL